MEYLRGYRLSPKLVLRVWQREVTLYRRVWPSTILSTLFDPILYLVAMGFGLGGYVKDIGGVPYIQFIGPGLVASSIMSAAAYEAAWNSYVRIFVERSYEGMMTTPAELEDVVAGEVAWAATRSLISSTVMLGVLAAFGLLRSWMLVFVPLVALVGGVMFTLLGLSYCVTRRYMDQLTFMFSLGITPMYLFSGIFFPLTGLPWWVQDLAWISPLYHVVEVVRALILGMPTLLTLVHLAWMAALVAVFWGLPSRILRRRLTS
ncbi:MAG: lipooligosaccharide transport system permease protein [Thermoplasmata archaeon]|jgi:lipooligosaccharide transport system permease protein|nr:lipooligosaccharide transport system permease protein [Thermoplasmata archaeon]